METPSYKFKLIHNELQILLKAEKFDEDLIQKKITKYIGYMVENNAQEQQKMFDYFCEYDGADIFNSLMIGDPLLAIKSYSLLFINLKNQMWISFILCQPFLMKAITLKCDSRDEQYTEYFVSFLKSLSIRIDSSQITLFFNKKNCTFPLVMAAMKYFNHPDFMVRTSVMNIILELMKNKQKKAQEYFSRFPFTSYLINFACEVNSLITINNSKISQQGSSQKLVAKHLTNYKVDLCDYFYYFNDLIEFGTPKAIEVIEQTIISYIVIPIFNWLLKQNRSVKNHALLLIHQCLRTIKNKQVINTIIILLFSLSLNRKAIDKIQKGNDIYKPQTFSKEFNVQSSYWGQYEEEIVGHCLQIFRDVEKFEVDYEDSKHQKSQKFQQEIDKISNFIGYDLLKDTVIQQRFIEIVNSKEDNIENPFKEIFLQMLKDSKQSWDILISIISNVLSNNHLSPDILDLCGLKIVSQERQEESHNSNEFLQKLKERVIENIRNIDWIQTTIFTLSNNLKLLKLLIQKEQNIQFQQILLQKNRQITNLFKEITIQDNMVFIVEKTLTTYKKINQLVQKNLRDISIAYPTIFVPQERWHQTYEQCSLLSKPNAKILHYIEHFFLFRSFVAWYFAKFYEAEYANFEQLYQNTFSFTSERWKKHSNYKITNRALISCFIEVKQSKKNKKAMIIEDKLNFVLAELNQKHCTILYNENWKNISFEINKEDGTCIDVAVSNINVVDKFRLFFQDQVRCNTTLVRLNDIKWEYYQYQLSFINKFIKTALQQ